MLIDDDDFALEEEAAAADAAMPPPDVGEPRSSSFTDHSTTGWHPEASDTPSGGLAESFDGLLQHVRGMLRARETGAPEEIAAELAALRRRLARCEKLVQESAPDEVDGGLPNLQPDEAMAAALHAKRAALLERFSGGVPPAGDVDMQ